MSIDDADVDARRRSRRTSRSPRTTCARRSCRPGRATPSRSRTALLGNDDVQLLVRHRHDDEPAVPQRRRRRAGLRAVGQRHAGERVRQPAGGGRRLRRRADRRDPSLGRRRRTPGCRAARPRSRAATSTSRRKYLTPTGQLADGAPYSERDLRGPDGPLLVDGEDVEVLVRTRAGFARHVHRDHPFDVVGWDGYVYPWALSIHDFEPIVGRIPPAAARAPDVRRRRLRRLLVRAPPLRLRPRRREGAVPPLQRRLRRGAVLLRRRLHEPRRVGHRRRLDQPAPRRVRPRPAARQPRAQRVAGPHERAGGDARHVRPARSQPTRRATSATPTTRGRGRAVETSSRS